jgi:hypothetical protein
MCTPSLPPARARCARHTIGMPCNKVPRQTLHVKAARGARACAAAGPPAAAPPALVLELVAWDASCEFWARRVVTRGARLCVELENARLCATTGGRAVSWKPACGPGQESARQGLLCCDWR